jgi:hypothetical protein
MPSKRLPRRAAPKRRALIASPCLSCSRSLLIGSNRPCRQTRMPMRVVFCCLLVGLSLIAGATASVVQAAES